MTSVYKTSRGTNIDIDRLKLQNEKTIAVGNAGVNARGDMVKGGKIIKSREELMQENYRISGNNIAKDYKIRENSSDIQPDAIPVNISSAADLTGENVVQQTVEQAALNDAPRGGLANAVKLSQEINSALDSQKKRI